MTCVKIKAVSGAVSKQPQRRQEQRVFPIINEDTYRALVAETAVAIQ